MSVITQPPCPPDTIAPIAALALAALFESEAEFERAVFLDHARHIALGAMIETCLLPENWPHAARRLIPSNDGELSYFFAEFAAELTVCARSRSIRAFEFDRD